MKRIFGYMEHLFFYLILIFLAIYLYNKLEIFVYWAIVCWLISIVSHMIESRAEKRNWVKIVFG